MKSILRVLLVLAVLEIIGPSTFACSTYPPPENISLTWQPLAKIEVLPDINSITAATTVIANWNNATFYDCYAPVFTFGVGTGEIMTVDWVPIASDPNGAIPRGKTLISISRISGRIQSAQVYLNNAILQTFPNTLVDVLAHEIGHTMGLNDCDYPGCQLYSSVMENLAPVPIWQPEGQPGPTPCDHSVMLGVATDYGCPPPPPPPPCCSCDPCPPRCTAQDLKKGKGKGILRNVSCSPDCCYTPIVIDTSGTGFLLTSAADGVKFDILSTGIPVQMGWTASDSGNAFLCLPDPNGACDDGKDLFGNKTPQPPSAHPNGFEALRVYDIYHLGVIDARSPIYSQLRLWVDANHDGVSQPNEIFTLPALGVTSISLTYKEDRKTDQYGNTFRYRAKVQTANGDSWAYDVFFVKPVGTTTAQVCPARPQLIPETKDGRLR